MAVDTQRVLRLSKFVLAAQLALVGLAAIVSRLAADSRARLWLIVALTACNGLIVATVSMGAARERTFVQRTLVLVLVVVAGLLFWPAWGEYESVRMP
ncbi:MAG: hypothetical protein AB7Q29_01715 [Vicinamibacterales bacterium]